MAPLAAAADPATLLERSSCTYTSCYCEENVYKLVEALAALGVPLADLFVTFISNPDQQVPLWEQRAGNGDMQGFIAWDYHVILLQRTPPIDEHCVWDLDTLLPVPVAFSEYCHKALRPDVVAAHLPPTMQRRYRVVAAGEYLRNFASDRSHMVAANGSWSAPPPPYPCIAAAADGALHTLPQYLDMTVPDSSSCSTGAGNGDNLGGGGVGGGGGGRGGCGGGGSRDGAAHYPYGQVLLEPDFVGRFGN